MHLSRRMIAALITSAILAGSAVTAGSALAAPTPVVPVVTSTLAPSVPSDPVLYGATAGSAPWALKSSSLQLLSNGNLQVSIQGLVIPELGTPGPVTSVNVSLYCGNETTPVATSASFKLSEKGNASLSTHLGIPAQCLAPAILINPLDITSIYIATGGFNNPTASPAVNLLNATLAPSVPTAPVLHGVVPGSAPWVINASTFSLLSNGNVKVSIQGLIIPELGNPGPVTSVDAALYCANETTPAFTTATAPLNEKGNGTITAKVTLPKTCLTPVVLINPLGIGSIYIAATGFTGMTGTNE